MAFLVNVDTRDTKVLGSGEAVTGYERQVYVLDSANVTSYDTDSATTDWKRIKGITDFVANEETTLIDVKDGRSTDHTKEGESTSTLSISQNYTAFHESIETLKNKTVFYAECLQDDRDPVDASGKRIFNEIHVYQGKLASFNFDKPQDSTYSVSGEGKYTIDAKKKIFRNITPVTVTIEGADNTATTGVAETYDIALADVYGAVIDGSDLSAANLAGEITSITIEKVSGTPTIAVADGASSDQKLVTFTGTGSCVVRAVVTCANSGKHYSADKTVVVS